MKANSWMKVKFGPRELSYHAENMCESLFAHGWCKRRESNDHYTNSIRKQSRQYKDSFKKWKRNMFVQRHVICHQPTSMRHKSNITGMLPDGMCCSFAGGNVISSQHMLKPHRIKCLPVISMTSAEQSILLIRYKPCRTNSKQECTRAKTLVDNETWLRFSLDPVHKELTQTMKFKTGM